MKHRDEYSAISNLRFVVVDATGVALLRFRPIDRVERLGSSFSPPVSICS